MNDPQLADSADAIIIGAGVIGSAIALELSRRSKRVVVVDKAASAGAGSTSNSCAIVRFGYSTEAGVNFAWEGAQYWMNWADHIGVDDELGLIEYHKIGQMVLLTDATTHGTRVKSLWEQLGIPHQLLSADEITERYPFLDLGVFGPPTRPDDAAFWNEPSDTIQGALFSPDSGYVSDPQLSCHNLQRAAEANGAGFRFRTEVTAITQAEGRVSGVSLADGMAIAAPIVINVAGPHSSLLNKMAGVYDEMNIKTKALRHEVHHVPAPEGIDFKTDGVVASDDDVGFYFRPEVGNNVLLGSVDADCDPQEFVDPDDYDESIDPDQWNTQVLRANRRIPSLGVPHDKKGVVDLYDVSDDWSPIYDRTALDGFYVAIGTSGNQYKNAGVAAQAMADLIEAVEAGHDHDANPVQVVGRYTGRTIDLGAYSRNREINPNSSMSVHG